LRLTAAIPPQSPWMIRVNSLKTIFGQHTCPHRGTGHGIVVVAAGNAAPVKAHCDLAVICWVPGRAGEQGPS
jgi:hypothetical protein